MTEYDVEVNMVTLNPKQPGHINAVCTIRGMTVPVDIYYDRNANNAVTKDTAIKEAAIYKYKQLLARGIEENCSTE